MSEHVGAVASRDLVTIAPDEPLFAALERMAERRIRHVLVLEAGELVGIVSNRDVVRAAMRPGRALDLHGTTVRDVMTASPLVTTEPERLLGDAAQQMLDARVSALPVLEGGRLVGIVTSDDLLTALARNDHPQAPRPDL